MKKVIILFLTIISFSASLNSQWMRYPSGSFSGPLYFVRFETNTLGYTGGNLSLSGLSIFYLIYNGGSIGVVINTHTTFTFYDFQHIDSTFLLCGSEKNVIKTAYNPPWGWITATTSAGIFYGIHFPSVNTGFAVGDSPGNVRKSTNAGTDWSIVQSPTGSTLKDVYFINNLTGWVCGENGSIFKTTDGCITWTNQSQSSVFNLEKMFFINSS